MNNLKQYKKHFGKEFHGSDEKTYMFYNSKAVTQMFTLINKLQQETKQLKEIISKTRKHIETLKEFDEANFGGGAYSKDWEELLEILGDIND